MSLPQGVPFGLAQIVVVEQDGRSRREVSTRTIAAR
jgi:hypothetical protein